MDSAIVNKRKKEIGNCEEDKNYSSDVTSQVVIDQSKNNIHHASAESIVMKTSMGKRKRRLSSTCTRSWHRKCMGGTPPTFTADNWICGECATILQAENAMTRSPSMVHLTVDQLCMVLKYVIERMRNSPGAEPFWSAVDLEEVPNYLDYIVKPMDLSLLEANINAKLYGSTDAFMADAKWIQHNCIVFNTCGGEYADTSKLSNAAKQIIKIARQEVSEIEACPDCYARGRNLPRPQATWFIEACRQPHPLVWAKLKGFPFWPAKALPRTNGQGHVDVRFFGEHDRAWVSPKDIYLYSRDPPTPLPRKKKQEMFDCIREITQHCHKLEIAFGPFQFAPPRIQYNPYDPTQIKLIFPEYDPACPYDSTKILNRENSLLSPLKKQTLPMKNTSTPASDALINNSMFVRDSENTVENSNDFNELEDNVKDHSNEINESLKQKNRLKKLPGNAEFEDSEIKLSNSSTKIGARMKKIKDVTPKKAAVRKTLLKKFVKPEKSNSIDEKSIETASQKVTTKYRKSYIRKDNATSPIFTPNVNGKINKSRMVEVYKPKTRIVEKLNSEMHNIYSEKSSIKSTNADRMHETLYGDKSNSYCSDKSIEENSSADTKINTQTSVNDNCSNYQLPPPEAGPLCAQLNHGANILAVRMARLIEEAIQEAAGSKIHDFGTAVDAHEATVYSLRLQIERMRWQHQQQLAELKYNTDQTLREMRASLEVERLRAIEEIRKEAEEERVKCVEEIKSKQWCAFCGREALYYCCWNTAYCNHECQQMHWQVHMRKCSQKPIAADTQDTNGAHQSQQREQNEHMQEMPTLVMSAQHDSSNVRGA
ncbi:hypothetical protein PV326_003073 [Microctonus aethiopoides]|nr:hypothetical protein PV326_003073 [Microctonus aethiopoides]